MRVANRPVYLEAGVPFGHVRVGHCDFVFVVFVVVFLLSPSVCPALLNTLLVPLVTFCSSEGLVDLLDPASQTTGCRQANASSVRLAHAIRAILFIMITTSDGLDRKNCEKKRRHYRPSPGIGRDGGGSIAKRAGSVEGNLPARASRGGRPSDAAAEGAAFSLCRHGIMSIKSILSCLPRRCGG